MCRQQCQDDGGGGEDVRCGLRSGTVDCLVPWIAHSRSSSLGSGLLCHRARLPRELRRTSDAGCLAEGRSQRACGSAEHRRADCFALRRMAIDAHQFMSLCTRLRRPNDDAALCSCRACAALLGHPGLEAVHACAPPSMRPKANIHCCTGEESTLTSRICSSVCICVGACIWERGGPACPAR